MRHNQISSRRKQPLYLLFVEVTAAFDRIPRRLLYDSISIRIPEGESCSISWENSTKKHLLLTRKLK